MMTSADRELLNDLTERAINQARHENGNTGCSNLYHDDITRAAEIMKSKGSFHHSQIRSALNAQWNRYNNAK
jgi:hypothetical protein